MAFPLANSNLVSRIQRFDPICLRETLSSSRQGLRRDLFRLGLDSLKIQAGPFIQTFGVGVQHGFTSNRAPKTHEEGHRAATCIIISTGIEHCTYARNAFRRTKPAQNLQTTAPNRRIRRH